MQKQDLLKDASQDFKALNAEALGLTLNAPQAKSDRVNGKASIERYNPYKRHTVIKMPYISNLSVNHYKFNGGKFTKPEVKEWMKDLVAEIQCCHVTDWKSPLKVTITVTFKDNRICDCHNLLKIICDSVEAATGLNDKYYSTETCQPIVDKKQSPNVIILISEI